MNPNRSTIAREDALRTGARRDTMFYGARAVPLMLAKLLQ
jgi:hypothetical protein